VIPQPHRAKGGAPQLGARYPGEPGPFGVSGQEPEDADGPGDGEPDLQAAVNNRVQQLVADARNRRDRQKAQRRQLEDARRAGLVQRYRAKLARLAEQDRQDHDDT
jgi:hypothetical protein